MYNPKIAIIMPTIDNDDVLMDSIESIIDNIDMNIYKIIIIDQNHPDTYSTRKRIFYETAASNWHDRENQKIRVIPLGYNCGSAYARNEGIKIASRERIPYILMTNDNIRFNKSMSKLEELTSYVYRYDVLGLSINDYSHKVGKIDLIHNDRFHFVAIRTKKCTSCYKKKVIFNVDIVDNFYLTRTSLYDKLRYDNSLKTYEKEDFFIRLKWNKYTVGFTKFCNGDYIVSPESNVKKQNLIDGKQRLKEKYNLRDKND